MMLIMQHLKTETTLKEVLRETLWGAVIEFIPNPNPTAVEIVLRNAPNFPFLSEEALRKVYGGTCVCGDYLVGRFVGGRVERIALAVRGDPKSVILGVTWPLGGRNKAFQEPVGPLDLTLEAVVQRDSELLSRLLSLQDVVGAGFPEIIKREAGNLAEKVKLIVLGVALTRFDDPHGRLLVREGPSPSATTVALENYSKVLDLARSAADIQIIKYTCLKSPEEASAVYSDRQSIGAVRSTIQPVGLVLLDGETFDAWFGTKKQSPGDGIKKIIVVTREQWENHEPILTDGGRYYPLAYVQDLLKASFSLELP
jgi:hypothetical protein